MTDAFIRIEKGLGPNGRIAVVRFDRGIRANPLSTEAMRQLRLAAESFEDDLETSVVILTGNATAFEKSTALQNRGDSIAGQPIASAAKPVPDDRNVRPVEAIAVSSAYCVAVCSGLRHSAER